MHWLSLYIGLPYKEGARGPEEVDCYGLVLMAYRDHYGIELPRYPGIAYHAAETSSVIRKGLAQDWIELDKPEDGCLAAMGLQNEVSHVALWANVEGGRFVHACVDAKMVIADTERALYAFRGIRHITFYRHRLWSPTLSRSLTH